MPPQHRAADKGLILPAPGAGVLIWAANNGGMRAQINYRARLVDGNGRTLGVTTGTAESKTALVMPHDVEKCVGSSVETMYEELSEKLLRPRAGERGRPALHPDDAAGTVEI
jgi:hypothetical protein